MQENDSFRLIAPKDAAVLLLVLIVLAATFL